MYDFHKIRQEDNENEFRHKFFRRGQKHLLAEIKRKSTDIVPESPKKPAPVIKNLELIKFKKDAQSFSTELSSMKSRQMELEKSVKTMKDQNNKLTDENKVLWDEMEKTK